ncbi:MAG: MOFRL family protein, partial [Planctomycetota bacterium]
YLSGGEPTVELATGSGRGGRNLHLVLSCLDRTLTRKLDSEYCFLSGGTDGEDGTVDVPGGYFDSADVLRLKQSDRDCRSAVLSGLERFDSYSVLSDLGLVMQKLDTYTNVCDLRVLLKSGR